MLELILELVKLASVGFLSAVLGSALANRDHRHQRYWELRVAAYQALIDALSDLVHYYDAHYNAELERRDLSEAYRAKLAAHWDDAFPRVRRAADSGAFIFSEPVNAALAELIRRDHEDDWFTHLDNNLDKSRRCLATIVERSKADLAIKPSLLDRFV